MFSNLNHHRKWKRSLVDEYNNHLHGTTPVRWCLKLLDRELSQRQKEMVKWVETATEEDMGL